MRAGLVVSELERRGQSTNRRRVRVLESRDGFLYPAALLALTGVKLLELLGVLQRLGGCEFCVHSKGLMTFGNP